MGVSARTLRRAADDLQVVKHRVGFGPGSYVTWRLPDDHPALRLMASGKKQAKGKAVDQAISQILGASNG
jgi:uncharacterized protein YijF (DUF1287 family)